MQVEVKKIVEKLGLSPHVEGGYYKRTYEAQHTTSIRKQSRFLSTAIYYLLEGQDFSCWHRLKSDEMWHYYNGSSIRIYQIDETGNLTTVLLGNLLENEQAKPQHLIPANTWFAAEVELKDKFTLIGCTVTPGFDFQDFEIGKEQVLIAEYPQHEKLIRQFCRVLTSK